jgi:hypothetical protein
MGIWLAPILKWLGHWLVYFLLSAVVIWGLYAGIIRPVTKPNPSTHQEGQIFQPKVYFGCANFAIPKQQK